MRDNGKGEERMESLLERFFSKLTKIERSRDLRNIDLKLISKLQEIGEDELADSIGINPDYEKKRPQHTAPALSLFAILKSSTMAFLGVLFVSFVFAFYFTPLGENKNGDKPDLATSKLPTITMRPQKITETGFVAKENSFVLQMSDIPEGDVEDLIKIEPAVDFTAVAQNDNSAIELKLADSLEPDTTYTISLAQGVEFANGYVLEEDIEWVFNVEPTFKLLSSKPAANDTGVSVDTIIQLDFNQSLFDLDNLNDSITITPEVVGRYEIDKNVATFVPSQPLEPSTTYTIIIKDSLQNSDEKRLNLSQTIIFKTSDVSERLTRSALRWSGNGTVHNVSGNIEATVRGDISDGVAFTLYQVGYDDVKTMLSDLENLNVPEGAEVIDSQTGSAIFTYSTSEKGAYLLQAKKEVTSIYKLFLVTSLQFNDLKADPLSGNVSRNPSEEGSAAITGIPVSCHKDGSQFEDRVIGEDQRFSFESCETLLLGKSDDFALLSVRNGDYLIDDYAGLHFDQSAYYSRIRLDAEEYNPGDSAIFIGFIDLNSEDTSTDPVEITIAAYDGRSSQVPLFEQKQLYDPEINGSGNVYGSFNLPVDSEIKEVYLLVRAGGSVVGFAKADISRSDLSSAVLSSAKESYVIGEGVETTLKVDSGDLTLKDANYQVKLYRTKVNKDQVKAGELDENVYPTNWVVIDDREFSFTEAGEYKYAFTPLTEGNSDDYYIYDVAFYKDGKFFAAKRYLIAPQSVNAVLGIADQLTPPTK